MPYVQNVIPKVARLKKAQEEAGDAGGDADDPLAVVETALEARDLIKTPFFPSLPKCRTPTVATSPKKQCFPISHRVVLLLFLKAIAHKTRYAEALQISLERRSFLLRKLLTAPAMWPKGALTEAEREQHAQV